jgi:chromosome segregation ATPase
VATDEEARAEFASGRLARERQAVGFGDAAAAALTPRGPKQRKPTEAQRRRAKGRVSKARKNLDAAVKRGGEARRALGAAQRSLDKAREEVEAADAARSKHQAELADAQAALDDLGDRSARQES